MLSYTGVTASQRWLENQLKLEAMGSELTYVNLGVRLHEHLKGRGGFCGKPFQLYKEFASYGQGAALSLFDTSVS